MNRNTLAVLVSVAVSLVAGLGQAQTTCTWNSVSGGNFSTGPWSTTPASGGNIDYVLMFTNSAAIYMTNDFPSSTFQLNGLVATKDCHIYGSNLEFRTSSSGALPYISGYIGNIGSGVTLTTNLTLSGTSPGSAFIFSGVISGAGTITNKKTNVNGLLYVGTIVANAGNNFVGNWVANAVNNPLGFANDGAIGAANNNIILDNGAVQAITGAGGSCSVTSGPNHVIVITTNGGSFSSRQSVGSTWMLTNANTLVGGGLLTIGQSSTLAVNAAQPNFTGQVAVVSGNVSAPCALSLGGANALTNASSITAGSYGTVTLGNPYAAGTATITNLTWGTITLNTNLVASGGTRVYLSDETIIAGTDTQLGSLTAPGNVTIAPGAYPRLDHSTAYGTGTIGGVDKTNLIWGWTTGGNANTNMTIGDGASGQWRGVGTSLYQGKFGATDKVLTLNGNAILDYWGGTSQKQEVDSKITGGSPAHTLTIRGGGEIMMKDPANDFTSMLRGIDSTRLDVYPTNVMTLTFAPGVNTFANIAHYGSGTVVFDGVGSTNTVNGGFSSSSGPFVFSNGYYITVATGNGSTPAGNVTLAGATITGSAWTFVGGNQQVNVISGSLAASTITINGGSGGGNSLYQSGGTVVCGATSVGSLTLISGIGKTNAYYLSGGMLSATGGSYAVQLTATNSDSSSMALFSMSGGKLVATYGISGVNTSARQVFDFSGGTLVANRIYASNLTSTNALDTTGTLVQNGGTLAPGDVGLSGQTMISGRYSNTVNTTVLAIDIGGTNASSAFQDGANAGKYDQVAISGNAYLNGNLLVNLIQGTTVGQIYSPASTNFFKILTNSRGGQVGTFNGSNVAAGVGGARAIATDGRTSFLILYNSGNVTLTNAILNEWKGVGGNWSTVGGANGWTAMDPSNACYIATLGTNGSGTLTLDGNRTVQSLTFTNPAASYTVSGANTLTLDNGTNVITVNDYAGSHAVNVPVVVNTSLVVNVARAGDTLTFGSTLTQSGTGFTLTKTGAGTLTLSNTCTFSGATTVSNGTLALAGSGALPNSPSITIASGATCDVSGVTGGYTVPAGQAVQGTGTLVGPVTINGVIRATLTDAVGGVSGPTYTGGVIIGSGATLDLGTSTNWLTGSTSTYTIIPSGVSGAAPGITLPRGWRVSTSGGALKLVQGFAGTMILFQ